jgi:phage tail tape-measure protein
MTEQRTIERKTVTDDGVERTETVEKHYDPGAPVHGDEQAGGAITGGVAGAAVGAVVGGPVGAVVGGTIGAATGATAGAADEAAKDHEAKDEEIITREERRP